MDENKYTTGELADACGTTVRTVQYYDGKELLSPSGYTEGGRRLYTLSDAKRLRLILMLKSLGLALSQIKGVLESPNSASILSALLDEREQAIVEEQKRQNEVLGTIQELKANILLSGDLKTLADTSMAKLMEDAKARKRWHGLMILLGIVMDVLWIGALIYGITSGIWWPFPVALVIVAILVLWMVCRYDSHVTYLCPACGAQFRPRLGAFFVSRHTPKTRKLTCPCCGEKDWCVEHYHAKRVDIASGECLPGTCNRS